MKKCLRWIVTFSLCFAFTVSAAPAEDGSLYDLHVALVDQNGTSQSIDRYRGHPVIVSLFYGNCPNACPLLIESIRATENALSKTIQQDLRVLLISIDPERDTPTALHELAKTRHIDTSRWTVATAPANDVRTIAAALNVAYRRLPNGDFNHTSVLTLLSPSGAILKQTSQLGKADAQFVNALAQTRR